MMAILRHFMPVMGLILTLASCQTPRHKEFDRVRLGMLKTDVIDVAGGPTRSQRWQGRDRWIYQYEPGPSQQLTREVHFVDGKVIYAGPPIAPAVSAEEQDRINEQASAPRTPEAKEARAWLEKAEKERSEDATSQPMKFEPVQ